MNEPRKGAPPPKGAREPTLRARAKALGVSPDGYLRGWRLVGNTVKKSSKKKSTKGG